MLRSGLELYDISIQISVYVIVCIGVYLWVSVNRATENQLCIAVVPKSTIYSSNQRSSCIVNSIKALGVTINCHLSMNEHVSAARLMFKSSVWATSS